MNSFIFSWLAGFFGFLFGFSRFYFMNVPLYAPIIMIIAALISCLIPMFPDYVNRYISYDIRSDKGTWLLIKINITTLLIQGMVYLILLSAVS